MIQRETGIRNAARVMLAVGALSAMVMALVFGAGYLRYVEWTVGAKASLKAASIEPYGDVGRLAMQVGFEAPDVGYDISIESIEFTLDSERGNLGYYRVMVSDTGMSWDRQRASVELSLFSDIPAEHWPAVRESRRVTIDATLRARLYLPGREAPVRIGLAGTVDTVNKEAVQ